jgi:tRNA(fMet)-specific endonuclease VapC
MRFMLDTNIVSDLVRNPQGRVASRFARVDEAEICTSIVVVAELRYGAEKKNSSKLRNQLEAVLAGLEMLSLEPPIDTVYGRLRAELERKGKLIGPNDLLIAAHALAAGLTLVTDNVEEFRRVPKLPVENWLR